MTAPVLAVGVAASLLLGSSGGGVGGVGVSIVDNAFVRGAQRPVVRVHTGTAVTWRWRSKQSHSVMVRSGPARFASPIRNHGTYVHRFTRPGTYRLVCSLHAPGMRMTVVVRR
ncbi:MAG: plastocyanin/azurin family copper-binding protein [Solirubrobacteraceae bacterium]